GDWAFSKGINRFVFHTFAHQPWENVKPGMTMGPHGMMGNRNTTWWEQGHEWMSYLSRSQYLLQQGTAVIDLGYVLSEDAPVGNSLPYRKNLNPAPPIGYDYGFIDANSFLKMTVSEGFVVSQAGMKYRVLILNEKEAVRPKIAKKINELIRQGATIVGANFEKSPSLEGFPKADAEVKKLASVIPEKSLEQTLAQIQLTPDALFKYIIPSTATSLKPMEYIHRKLEKTHIYFVSNQNEKSVLVECSFRVDDLQPELWYPDKGTIEPAANFRQLRGRTLVSLNLQNMESVFVIFRKPLSAEVTTVKAFTLNGKQPENASLKKVDDKLIVSARETGTYYLETVKGKVLNTTVNEIPKPYVIETGWRLNFPASASTSNPLQLPKLTSWTENDNFKIKHFSGTANYEVEFDLPEDMQLKLGNENYTIQLDLGEVAVIASAKLNDKDLGILWKEPFSTDITNHLVKGKNKLQVSVTNLWVNRLIGDDHLAPDIEYSHHGSRGRAIKKIPDWVVKGGERPNTSRQTFSTWMFFDKNSPLIKSGLIGPVKIVFSSEKVLK
ncbi:MAG TPA: glycosyl hydrolase, partial [Pelobium sp.]|nr:glycosyl hydrolase [Pelobium sp.]